MPATDNFIKVRNAEGGVHRLAAADLPTGGGTVTDEQIRDVIGAALVAGANVTITVNDAGDTITIAATSSGGTNYWKMVGTSLQVNTATTGTLQEFIAQMPSLNTGFYAADYGGASSTLVQVTSEGDIEIASSGGDVDVDATATVNLNAPLVRISSAIIDMSYAAASVSGATSVDPTSTAAVYRLTLTGNITLTIAASIATGRALGLTLYLVQDGTGSRLVTWPSSVKWPGSIVPVLSTVGNSVDVVVMETFDGGTTWYANLAGKDYR